MVPLVSEAATKGPIIPPKISAQAQVQNLYLTEQDELVIDESHDSLNTGNSDVTPSLSLATDSYNQRSKNDRDAQTKVQSNSQSNHDGAKANTNQEMMTS